MIKLLIPCAGKSSRFHEKPKWLLTCPNGNLMIQESIAGLDLTEVDCIYITFLKEHIERYCKNCDLKKLFAFTNKKINIYILDQLTKSQTETVYKTIKHFNINDPIFIKDCDNYYTHKIIKQNYICYIKIDENNNISKPYNKSFIEFNNQKQLSNICEKKIISDNICVGGYSFINSTDFISIYDNIISLDLIKNELYISHIINQALLMNIIFNVKEVKKYIDWGTIGEWDKYKSQFKTLFVDLDGVLVYNSSKYFTPKWGDSEPIIKTVDHLNKMYKTNKVKIIITTARSSLFKDATIKQLQKYNIPYDNIIFDLYHAQRILINDYSNTNKYPTSISINLKRDTDELANILI